MSWLSQLTSAEATTSFTGFIKNLESKIDKVLDIPNEESTGTSKFIKDTKLASFFI
jgi:hypothetical protein